MAKSTSSPVVRLPPRIFWLAYTNPPQGVLASSLLLHRVRDGMAFVEMAAAFIRAGYDLATTIHLLADNPRTVKELPALTPADLLVLTTRPPMNDGGHRAVVPRHGGELETLYVARLRHYFEFCDRAEIRLSAAAAALLTPERAEYAHMHFFQNVVDVLQYFGPKKKTVPPLPPQHANSTVAFLVRVPQLDPVTVPCGLVVAFGMSGLSTLAWNRVLRTRHSEWLTTRRFVMAKLKYGARFVGESPMTPEFADDESRLRVEVLAEEML